MHTAASAFEPRATRSSVRSRRLALPSRPPSIASEPSAPTTWPEDAVVRVRDGLAQRRGPPCRRRLRRVRGQPGGADRGGRAWRPGRPVRADAAPAEAALLANGVTVRDLGRHVLRDVPRPERLYQLDVPGLQATFRRFGPVGRPRQPARAHDHLHRVAGKRGGPGDAARGKPAGHPDRTRRHRQDVAGDRAGDACGRTGCRTAPGSSDSTPSRTRTCFEPRSPAASGCSTGRTVPRRPACSRTWPSDRRSCCSTTSSTCSRPPARSATILRDSPGTRVVVTSRAPLRFQGEQDYPVAHTRRTWRGDRAVR